MYISTFINCLFFIFLRMYHLMLHLIKLLTLSVCIYFWAPQSKYFIDYGQSFFFCCFGDFSRRRRRIKELFVSFIIENHAKNILLLLFFLWFESCNFFSREQLRAKLKYREVTYFNSLLLFKRDLLNFFCFFGLKKLNEEF